MLGRIKNLLYYSGLTKSEYDRIEDSYFAPSLEVMKIVYPAGGLMCLLYAIASYCMDIQEDGRFIFLLMGLFYLAVSPLVFGKKPISTTRLRILTKVFMCSLYFFSLYVDTFVVRDQLSVFFMVVIVLLPILFNDRPIELFGEMLLNVVAFSVFTMMNKNAGQAYVDVANAIIASVISMVTSSLIYKSKAKGILAEKQLQEALEEAKSANDAKTKFLHNVSHDIRTPINGIVGMLEVLRKSKNDPLRISDCIEKIDYSAKVLMSLVNDVIDTAKLEKDSVVTSNESVNLEEICGEIVGSVVFQAESAGISVHEDHDDYQGVYVRISPQHLKRILINLFTNSLKYNKPGGSIFTSMKTLVRTEDKLTIEFKIRDTGIGMSEEFVKTQLFEPFAQEGNSSRTSYQGSGLGMSIVKLLVEKMGGSISVESTPGEGTCFTVVLPFDIDRNAGNVENTPALQYADISGKRFLVAEDNELNMEIIEFFLTDNGAQVERAENGLVALQKFERSEPGTYDAILMDVMMPVMDGLAATGKIRESSHPQAKTIPIVAMTANAFDEDRKKSLEAGMNGFATKPIEPDKILEILSGLLH